MCVVPPLTTLSAEDEVLVIAAVKGDKDALEKSFVQSGAGTAFVEIKCLLTTWL